jgi:PAS domain S-box-containing protein
MNNHAEPRIDEIRNLLNENPHGMSISEIAEQLGMKRNVVSGDLNYLQRLGHVEMQSIGTSKVYFPTTNIPLSGLLNYSSDMILVLDDNRIILEANAPLLKMTGRSRDETVGRSIAECSGPFFEAIVAMEEREEGIQDLTLWLPQLDDPRGIRHFRAKQIPAVFENTCRGTMIMIEDITEEIRYRDALRLSEAQYKAIVEDQTDLIFRFLPDGTVTYVNRIFRETFGEKDTEFRGEDIHSYFSGKGRAEFLEHVHTINEEAPVITRVHEIPAGKDIRRFSLTLRAIFNEGKKIVEYQGIGRDISAELDARDQMIRNAAEKEFLYRKSQNFLDATCDSDIFAHLSSGIAEIVPDAVVILCSYDDSTRMITSRVIRDEKGIDLSQKIFDGKGLEFFLSPEILSKTGEYERIQNGQLAEIKTDLLFLLVGDASIRRLEKAIGYRTVYATLMVWEGNVIGATAVCLPKGDELKNRVLVETCISMAALTFQRYSMKESLSLSKNRFSMITETSPLPIAIIGPEGRYLFLNTKFVEKFGYTLDDIPDGKRWFLHAFPDAEEMQKAQDLWLRDLKNSKEGEMLTRQFRVRCKDGSFKMTVFHPVILLDGCQLVIYEDISGIEEAERIRNLLAEIVRSSHDAIIGMTITGRIQTWNPGAERIYGYTAEEAVGKDIEIIFPSTLLDEKEWILVKVRSGEFISDFETKRVRKDGALIDVSVTISPIFDRQREIIGTSTIVKDITAKKAEERLRALESKYQEMVDSINVGVYRSTGDPLGKFIWGNSYLVKILGYSSFEAVRELPIADIFLQANGRKELIEELRCSGFVKNRELLLKKSDGSVIYVRVTALATFGSDGEISYINGIVEDITENRVLSRKLASLQGTSDDNRLSPS